MTLISALLGIAADRLLPRLHEHRQYDYFLRYVDWMRERLSGPGWDHIGSLLLILVPVWLAVALLQNWVDDWLYGLAGLLLYVMTLVYCLGPRDLVVDVDTFCEVCETSDASLLQRAAGRLLNSDEVPEDKAECGQAVTRSVLVGANDRLFAVLFWFVLLGPLGAVLYRSTAVLYQQRREPGEFGDSVAWVYSALIWIPARLLALGYALSGHFDAAIEGWRDAHQDIVQGAEGSEAVLADTGYGALGLRDEDFSNNIVSPIRAAMRLVWRTLTIWLVVLAILTLAGWAG